MKRMMILLITVMLFLGMTERADGEEHIVVDEVIIGGAEEDAPEQTVPEQAMPRQAMPRQAMPDYEAQTAAPTGNHKSAAAKTTSEKKQTKIKQPPNAAEENTEASRKENGRAEEDKPEEDAESDCGHDNTETAGDDVCGVPLEVIIEDPPQTEETTTVSGNDEPVSGGKKEYVRHKESTLERFSAIITEKTNGFGAGRIIKVLLASVLLALVIMRLKKRP